MKTGTKEYFDSVIHEVKMLKVHATNEEIERLDIERLEPRSGSGCIYGQMTGYCFSDRATELIELCAKPQWANDLHDEFKKAKGFARGSLKPAKFTALEHCIVQYGKNNPAIIAYLKGERKTLKLKA